MITRIVKMEFSPEKTDVFLNVFSENEHRIASFPGCRKVELLRDVDTPNVFFTYSHWEKAEDLEAYRHSEVFHDVWSKTKILFQAAPQAWSTTKLNN